MAGDNALAHEQTVRDSVPDTGIRTDCDIPFADIFEQFGDVDTGGQIARVAGNSTNTRIMVARFNGATWAGAQPYIKWTVPFDFKKEARDLELLLCLAHTGTGGTEEDDLGLGYELHYGPIGSTDETNNYGSSGPNVVPGVSGTPSGDVEDNYFVLPPRGAVSDDYSRFQWVRRDMYVGIPATVDIEPGSDILFSLVPIVASTNTKVANSGAGELNAQNFIDILAAKIRYTKHATIQPKGWQYRDTLDAATSTTGPRDERNPVGFSLL